VCGKKLFQQWQQRESTIMTRKKKQVQPWRIAIAAVGVIASSLLCAGAQAALIGPVLPYLGFNDSPFKGLSFSYFYLETFEDNLLNTPGVTASTGAVVGPGTFVDSVDGGGDAGRSFFTLNGVGGITFTFDKAVLGKLPTHVGIVWTDGDAPKRTFKAFDQNNVLLGTIIDSTQKFFSTGGDDDPKNYRFFGVTNPGGISSIFINNDSGGIEVDHLQYGFAAGVPELSSWAMMLVGFSLVGVQLRRRNGAALAPG